MPLPASLANRLGFALLGLTNNFAYVVMLSAAYDLLKQVEPQASNPTHNLQPPSPSNSSSEKYCNEHSTSTVLLADSLPSLFIKMAYPFLFVTIPHKYKVSLTALLNVAAFTITGFSSSKLLIFTGVVCASLASGLGETTYLSNTPLYGDAALSGWSVGTGAAGLLGSAAYAILRIMLSTRLIMLTMLVAPLTMVLAYFFIITPLGDTPEDSHIDFSRRQQLNQIHSDSQTDGGYGANLDQPITVSTQTFNFMAKLHSLPPLAKYFLPLLLVYFAEYFINQGLLELIYYPNISVFGHVIDHASQYTWFQVSYQLGVLISRSSLDFMTIGNIWAMSILQAVNTCLFLAHTSKLIHIPSFLLVIGIIIYEGLLGGFTYVNTFYRIKKEVNLERQEFAISTVTVADSLGIVMAGFVALPVHDALCKLYL